MVTYIIFAIIIIYSGWVLYRNFRDSIKGKNCGSCKNCSLNSSCDLDKKKE
ncbi:MAG: FeoB-associated Cys-rich membrane protein [Vulcanibacillus sp.]